MPEIAPSEIKTHEEKYYVEPEVEYEEKRCSINEALEKWLKEEVPILCLTGESGIGKSALIEFRIKRILEEKEFMVIDIDALTKTIEQVRKTIMRKMRVQLEEKVSDLEEAIERIAERNIKTVIIIDSTDDARAKIQEILDLINDIKDIADDLKANLKLIYAIREEALKALKKGEALFKLKEKTLRIPIQKEETTIKILAKYIEEFIKGENLEKIKTSAKELIGEEVEGKNREEVIINAAKKIYEKDKDFYKYPINIKLLNIYLKNVEPRIPWPIELYEKLWEITTKAYIADEKLEEALLEAFYEKMVKHDQPAIRIEDIEKRYGKLNENELRKIIRPPLLRYKEKTIIAVHRKYAEFLAATWIANQAEKGNEKPLRNLVETIEVNPRPIKILEKTIQLIAKKETATIKPILEIKDKKWVMELIAKTKVSKIGIKILKEYLKNKNASVRRAAMRAVDGLVGRSDVSVSDLLRLLDRWLRDEDWYVRRAAMRAVDGLVGRSDVSVSDLLRLLDRWLGDKDWGVRLAAIEAVKGLVGRSDVSVSDLLRLLDRWLGDKDWGVRLAAMRAVKGLVGRSDVSVSDLLRLLDRGLGDKDEGVRLAAMRAVKGLVGRSDVSVSDLLRLLDRGLGDKDEGVRLVAMRAVDGLVGRSDVSVSDLLRLLDRGLGDKDEGVRLVAMRAVDGLVGRSDVSVSDLLRLLDRWLRDEDGDVRLAAIEAVDGLVGRSDVSVSDLLRLLDRGLRDEDGDVRLAAIEAVDGLVGRSDVSVSDLLRLLDRGLRDEDGDVRLAAIEAVDGLVGRSDVSVSDLLRLLDRGLRDEDGDVRLAAVEAVKGLVGRSDVSVSDLLRLLDRGLRDEDGDVRRAAVEAVDGLVGRSDVSVSDLLRLLDRGLRDEDGDVRLAAVEAVRVLVSRVSELSCGEVFSLYRLIGSLRDLSLVSRLYDRLVECGFDFSADFRSYLVSITRDFVGLINDLSGSFDLGLWWVSECSRSVFNCSVNEISGFLLSRIPTSPTKEDLESLLSGIKGFVGCFVNKYVDFASRNVSVLEFRDRVISFIESLPIGESDKRVFVSKIRSISPPGVGIEEIARRVEVIDEKMELVLKRLDEISCDLGLVLRREDADALDRFLVSLVSRYPDLRETIFRVRDILSCGESFDGFVRVVARDFAYAISKLFIELSKLGAFDAIQQLGVHFDVSYAVSRVRFGTRVSKQELKVDEKFVFEFKFVNQGLDSVSVFMLDYVPESFEVVHADLGGFEFERVGSGLILKNPIDLSKCPEYPCKFEGRIVFRVSRPGEYTFCPVLVFKYMGRRIGLQDRLFKIIVHDVS